MTTKAAGGRITGLLALTFEAQEALQVGDAVQLSGDYEVEKADGTKFIVGHVSVANVKRDRVTSQYPVSNVPGDVTVEVRGFEVRRGNTGEAITAGSPVGEDAAGDLVEVLIGDINYIGTALMGSAGADESIDVLVR